MFYKYIGGAITATTILNFRVDTELKENFTKLADELGVSPTSMFTAFMKKAIAVQGIPFSMTVKPLSEKRLETRKKITDFYHNAPAIDLDDNKNMEAFLKDE